MQNNIALEENNIYQDISKRTNGDIYLGVVGPVRVGKSTFITKFMENLVIPNIDDENVKVRTIDELPQSADGKTIMTTQPKFVPSEAVNIKVDNIAMNVRLIDCVGYFVAGALGNQEGEKPRLVKTPWSDEDMPLERAAEIGTEKVIKEHSTVGVVMTSDGSFGELGREAFLEGEQRVVSELKEMNKPFVVVLNTVSPHSQESKKLAGELSQKYGVSVLPMDVVNLSIENINEVFVNLLKEFPIVSLEIDLPLWMQALPFDNSLIQSVVGEFRDFSENIFKIGDVKQCKLFSESEDFDEVTASAIKLGEGKICFELRSQSKLFYKVLSEQCGMQIDDEFHLMSQIKDLAVAKKEYDKLKDALSCVEETGYGVVNPKVTDMVLDEPIVVKQGGRYGVKLHASAPSLHLMKVDIETDISPLVGTEEQTNDFVKYLQSEFENNPQSLWNTNVFGRSLSDLIADGIKNKLNGMPSDAQRKMRKTLTKIVNEGKGGIICILL